MIQQGLDQWFLRQDVIDQLLQSGDDDLEGINAYADRILMIAQTEEAEHQTLLKIRLIVALPLFFPL